MISHKHRCIFIHIPRCAGTSIETWLTGYDWWAIRSGTKHLLASQARKIYSNFWDQYFKFAFVRDPIERMISCLAFGDHFGLSYDRAQGFSFSRYHQLFGQDVVVEHDHRFWRRDELLTSRHKPGSVYGNILDEPVDFIGRFENLDRDIRIVASAIGKPEPFKFHEARAIRSIVKAQDLSRADILHIETMFRQDMSRFSYHSLLPDLASGAQGSGASS
jgi:sulfotransferase famil protein